MARQDGDVNDRSEYRIEQDTMGEVRVPADARWRAQTQRAIENFPVSGRGLEPAHVRALAQIKAAAAEVNADLGVLDREVAEAIVAAALAVAAGEHDDHFPIDVFQTGSGTSSNMNANEVIATIAAERLGQPIHPNDQVNASQSSNDVFPSSIHLAATSLVVHELIPALRHLAFTIESKVDEFRDIVKAGRTHLMDATPITLGQEFSGYAAQMQHGIERLQSTLPRLAELPLGGTAVGTGVNSPPGFAPAVIDRLRSATGLPLTEARNHFEAQGARDSLVEASGQLRTIAVGLYKIANDIRWMGSGPGAGLREMSIPDLQPGSSIMPGKVNPVIPEVVNMVCFRVIGSDLTVSMAAEAGQLQLNVFEPVIAACIFEAQTMFINAARTLRTECVDGITANPDVCRHYVEFSIGTVTALNPIIGYERSTELAAEAMKTGRGIMELIREKKVLTDRQIAEVLDPIAMTGQGRS